MKKLNLPFGILLTFILALVSFSIQYTKLSFVDWKEFPCGMIAGILSWILHNALMLYKEELGFKTNSFLLGLMSILAVAFVLFIFEWSYWLVLPISMQLEHLEGWRKCVSVLRHSITLSSLYYFICRHINVLKDTQQHLLEIGKLKEAQLEANLSSLKEQLSPHFLFNTLNTLSTLTTEKTVKDYVAQLANVYRYVLKNKINNTTTLSKELEFAKAYLYIMQIRYDEALTVNIDVDEKFGQTQIAPFSLQLLVENAMKHNIASLSKPLHILLFNIGDEYIVVQNNLQEKNTSSNSTGIGLNNIMERYKYLFQREVVIEKDLNLFKVKLPIIHL